MTRYILELARSSDDAALRRVMAESSMPGSVALTFQREPSYFQSNCVLGHEHQTVVCRDTQDDQIVGVGTRSVRDMYVAGKRQRIGYLSGLRIRPQARRRGLLARGFRFFKQLHDADNDPPEYYLTTIAEGNEAAIAALIGGRAGLPYYHQLGSLRTFVLPVSRRQRNRLQTQTNDSDLRTRVIGSERELAQTVEFLQRHGPQRNFFPFFDRSDWEPYEGTFRGLQREAMLSVWQAETLIGVSGLWDQRNIRQTIIGGYYGLTRHVRPLINLWAQARGGTQLPKIGDPLRAAYVSFPVVLENRADVFEFMLQHMLVQAPHDLQCLLVGLCDNDPWLPIARSLSTLHYATKVYAVTWKPHINSDAFDSQRPHYLELGCL